MATLEPRALVPVNVVTLCPPAVLDFELYLRHENSTQPLLYRERNIPLEKKDVQRLLENGVTTLYIPTESANELCRYVRETLMRDETRPPIERLGLLKEATRGIVVDALNSGGVDKLVNVTLDLSQQLVDLLWRNDVLVSDVFSVMAHDYYTFTHMTNVGTYSILLAREFGIADPAELAEIGQGSLLHDIGKRQIPSSVLRKPSQLTSEEFAIVKQHPRLGFEDLCFRNDLSWRLLTMVYHHHERMNGSGYPVALEGDEIHPWARLCAITDVFDALTRDRPYRKGMITQEVCEHLEKRAGRGFDKEMVECWVSTMSKN